MLGLIKLLTDIIGCLIVYENIVNVLKKNSQVNVIANILPKKLTC
jgi:hypothetical protein